MGSIVQGEGAQQGLIIAVIKQLHLQIAQARSGSQQSYTAHCPLWQGQRRGGDHHFGLKLVGPK